jgi:hypothetical protein
MPGITGRGTTFNLPNFHGDLTRVTPSDTPFLSAIGGLQGGGDEADSRLFEWQTSDLRAPAQNTRVEGADAPPAEERVRLNVSNVVQIHQEAVDISYTKLATSGEYTNSGAGSGSANPILNESTWQVMQRLAEMARDLEFSFLQGVFLNPVDNTQARRTRGLLGAIVTNVVTAPDGDAALAGVQPSTLTEAIVMDLLQQVWTSGGIQVSDTATLICGAWQKRQLSRIFITDKGYTAVDRNVGGVNVQTIETDFGRLNLMLNRYMPIDQLAVVSLDQCEPMFLPIPGKGFLFVEPLAKVGASDRSQLYGEVGLKYGAEQFHGKALNLKTT